MKTIQEVIKLLPFQGDFKTDLLKKYDHMSDDQRFSVERLVWGLYDALYDAKLKINIEKAFERAKKNEEKLDPEFYARVRKQTEQEFLEESSTMTTDVDLSSTREELQELLKQTQPSN